MKLIKTTLSWIVGTIIGAAFLTLLVAPMWVAAIWVSGRMVTP